MARFTPRLLHTRTHRTGTWLGPRNVLLLSGMERPWSVVDFTEGFRNIPSKLQRRVPIIGHNDIHTMRQGEKVAPSVKRGILVVTQHLRHVHCLIATRFSVGEPWLEPPVSCVRQTSRQAQQLHELRVLAHFRFTDRYEISEAWADYNSLAMRRRRGRRRRASGHRQTCVAFLCDCCCKRVLLSSCVSSEAREIARTCKASVLATRCSCLVITYGRQIDALCCEGSEKQAATHLHFKQLLHSSLKGSGDGVLHSDVMVFWTLAIVRYSGGRGVEAPVLVGSFERANRNQR
jgi:hypothetical protein